MTEKQIILSVEFLEILCIISRVNAMIGKSKPVSSFQREAAAEKLHDNWIEVRPRAPEMNQQ